MNDQLFNLIVFFISFIIAMYALSAINFRKLMHPNTELKVQLLYFILAAILALLFTKVLLLLMKGSI